VKKLASDKILAEKESYVKDLKAKLTASQSGVVFNYGGITVEQDTQLRKQLREAGVFYEVVKNTMMKIAIKDTSLEGMESELTGTTAIAISGDEDPLAAARILHEFAEKSKGKFELKTGYMDGAVLTKPELARIATLPSKEGLLSMLLSALNGNISGLARALNAVVESKNKENTVA
jgi:large subunit ribosomal protein L10